MSIKTATVSPREFRANRRGELSQTTKAVNSSLCGSTMTNKNVTLNYSISSKASSVECSPSTQSCNYHVTPTGKLKKQRRSSTNLLHSDSISKSDNAEGKQTSSLGDEDKYRKSSDCSTTLIESLGLKERIKNRNCSPVSIVTQLSQQLINKQPKKQLILPAISPKINSDNKTPEKSEMKKRKLCNNQTPQESRVTTQDKKLTDPPNDEPVCSSFIEVSERDNESPSTHSDDNSDDDLPCLHGLQAPSNFDLSTGRLVWVKFRKYPRWPGIICKTDQMKKRAAIKYINYENLPNGLWVKRMHLSEFPGDRFNEFEQEAAKHPSYTLDIQKAIKMVNSYLHEKLSDQSLDPLTHFFPNSDVEEISYESGLSSDVEEESGDDSVSGERVQGYTAVKSKEFGPETQQQIAKRETWLGDLTRLVMEDPIINQKISRYISRKGKSLKKLASRHSFLGPLSYSTTDQGARLLDHIVSTYESLTKSITLPEWCYTSLIPWVIISGIQKLDGVSFKKAESKYFTDMRTEEEDISYHNQLVTNSEQLSGEDAIE
ncbi:PWWP domain-containing DNA repair factor 3A-like [Watersipora subatra]|uniref:PWWP domain-containing DNA repair factor 3A-like n=1 Tax=Watersipora subatra TaxID=2589382 RepID=UPI00355AD85C